MQSTEFAWSVSDLGEGMRFQVTVGSIGVALAMFGLTGVGAGEITSYTYWCVEKGCAAWTGPRDGSTEWVTRANGWISVMKIDAWVAWCSGSAPASRSKTVIANVPLQVRIVSNALAVFNAFERTDQRRRDRWMRLLMIILPLGWGIIGIVISAPLALVLFGGVLNAVYLIGSRSPRSTCLATRPTPSSEAVRS